LLIAITMFVPNLAFGQSTVQATLLHTNDFHGRLEADSSGRGGSAYMASKLTEIRAAKGAENVVLMDAGDEFFAAPAISQLLDGESTIDVFNMLGYDLAVFGNHEFDKGQGVLQDRITQSSYPWLGANVVLEGTDWNLPPWTQAYELITVGNAPDQAVIGVIGVAAEETPDVTLLGVTDGLVFKDLAETIAHYYDEVMAQADALVVVAHMGTDDSGPYEGLVTIAQALIDDGKPVDLMIGGHQHQALFAPVYVGDTTIVSAGYYGRYLGQVDVTIDTTSGGLTVDAYTLHTIGTALAADPAVEAEVAYWAGVVAPIVNQPVGQTNIDLVRDYNNESVVGDLVADSMLWKADAYDDGEVNGSVDIAFTNPGGLRADIVIPDGAPLPYTVSWGETFDVLPFGNTLFLMDLTGAQIQGLLDKSANLYKGILQSAGISHYWYNDNGTNTPTAWGAYGVMVDGQPLERDETYRVVTNNFLAGGQDGWTEFADGTNRWDTYYDMQQGLVEYMATLGVIDEAAVPMGRIVRLDNVVTILHVNDTHGRWLADNYHGGMAYLASLIAAERAHNPNALLLDAGDTFQGNSFAYFFKDRPDNPIAGGMNLLGFDAMTVGNHEFNFGPQTFATMLGQLSFPILGTVNLDDDGSYGFINDNLQDYINLDVNGLKVTIFGLTNPRIYRYELPTNIPGLTFYPALDTVAPLVPELLANESPDLLVGLTHVGFSPYGDEIDSDELIAQNVAGIDVLVGGHSHTRLNPAVMVSSALNPEGTLIGQAQRYAGYLGKINVGWIGGEMVLREGYLIPAAEAEEDPVLAAYLAPYNAEIDAYNATPIGHTLVPLDALHAYTEETNGANLQADSAVFELAQSGIFVDGHLSGAMTNSRVANGATPDNPVELTKGDMFNLMPYENSLVVFSMNGPQIKSVLERAYRNYYYYTYVPGYGGYSHYTTCMLDTDSGNQIAYRDMYPELPNGNNVASFLLNGQAVDFNDADTYYLISTVNYLAAGSCNFNDDGETIWPLDQIAFDTQYYVRDTVIDYVSAQEEPIAPAVEGRLDFIRPGACPAAMPYGVGYWKNRAGMRGNQDDCVSDTLPLLLGNNGGPMSQMVETSSAAVQILSNNGDASNGINKLRAQLLAARLNIASGVDNTGIVATVYAADLFLGQHTWNDWDSLTRDQRMVVRQWTGMLEEFNNG
jgi:2',3'-cyclic-nucleotide 2'-phosphodiesterase (5'-nucleotidase family)